MAKRNSGVCEPVVKVSDITREQWLEYRRTGIGGSDASTIVGLNPYSSPYYLFCDKMGALPEKDDTEAMRQGRDLEQYVADRWMERTGKTCRRNNYMWRSTRWPWMLADIDREIVGENAGLECKTTSPYNKHDFAGGEVPLTYYAQCQHYMAVMGFDRMYLAVLVLNRGFYDFVIDRDDDEIEALAAAEGEFWDLLRREEPPPIDGSEATQDALRLMYPEEDGRLSLNLPQSADRDLNRLVQLQGVIKDLKAECDAIKNEMMARMGDAALADTSSKRCSWVTRKKSSIDTKKLKQQFPEIYRQFEKTTEFRVFSVKNKKQEA